MTYLEWERLRDSARSAWHAYLASRARCAPEREWRPLYRLADALADRVDKESRAYWAALGRGTRDIPRECE